MRQDLHVPLPTPNTHLWLTHRYMDVVPLRAGKLEALNHVRRHFGFSVASTVACGDSGNDILMLSGGLGGLRGSARERRCAHARHHTGTTTRLL